jgi:hypothetical protein
VLKTTNLTFTPSVERLVKIWANRYVPDLSPLYSVSDRTSAYTALALAASPTGRALTAERISGFFVNIRCKMAAIKSYGLYTSNSGKLDLNEAYQLSNHALLVYAKLLEIYQQPSFCAASLEGMPLAAAAVINSLHGPLGSWGMPPIEDLAKTLEPVLLDFQQQHITAKNWRTLGFITTLLNFSNELIPKKITLPEQVLIKPYFQFVEEQVALPWERVCSAAANHSLGSPALTLVEQMLPQSREIAQAVYQRLLELLPDHRSRRGKLTDPGITHSCLRDLEMFQAYLWLCLLEGSLAPIKDELVDLCVMVMTGVKVKWEMTELWNKVLAEEILARVTPDQALIVLPYTEGLQKAFLEQKERFKLKPEDLYLPDELHETFHSRGKRSFYFPKRPYSVVE